MIIEKKITTNYGEKLTLFCPTQEVGYIMCVDKNIISMYKHSML